ncbi:hypothetical protein F5Y01DRAFT_12639 [Xylaria sp. FL0043]|nr:hypothetical protein F5Y01DRAFT_12639 [Xylaria sp. FL0043]
MTTQTQAHSGSGAPSSSGAPMENATTISKGPSTGLVASSVAGDPDSHVLQELNRSILTAQTPDPRPPLGSRGLSTDLMDEIRKVIRQEFLGAYTPKDRSHRPESNNGGASLMNTDTNSDKKRSLHPTTTDSSKSTHDESDDGSGSSVTAPGSGSDRIPTPATSPTPTTSPSSTVSAPPLSLVTPAAAAKPEPPRPGVRFSDNVTLVRNPAPAAPTSGPAKKAPWFMYRRMSSSGGDAVPDWGVLFDANGFATARCGQVLRGLAKSLVW